LITDLNPFLIRLLDYPREDFLGKTLWDNGPFRQIQESKAAFRELQDTIRFQRGTGQDVQIAGILLARLWRRDDGCAVRQSPLLCDGRNHCLVVADAGSQRLPCGPEPQNKNLVGLIVFGYGLAEFAGAVLSQVNGNFLEFLHWY
jgi:hypothetical protein